MITITYLQSHSHFSLYISTCTYVREGQLLSWSILLTNSESQKPLALPQSSILVRAVHDYEYIQIQYDYYGMIIITIQLWCIHSLAKYIQLSI